MQIDMHYFGVYVLARSAGVNKEAAKVIATASQFVDDNAKNGYVVFRDGGRFDHQATGHHALDGRNLLDNEQRIVWVPFHFLPGSDGVDFAEKLICRKDSAMAQEMIDNHLSLTDRPFALELIGITAHVYADTFAHHGFSGISHPRNMVANDNIELVNPTPEIKTYLTEKAKQFFGNGKYEYIFDTIISSVAEKVSGALGHGAAATYPDRPYLEWSYETEHPERVRISRNNVEDFLEGCEALHGMFRRFVEASSDFGADSGKDFTDIEDRIRSVLETQARKKDRIEAWQEVAKSGDLFFGLGEKIPDYDEEDWILRRDRLVGTEKSNDALEDPIYRFFQAAHVHRSYVLRELLPKHGLIVD